MEQVRLLGFLRAHVQFCTTQAPCIQRSDVAKRGVMLLRDRTSPVSVLPRWRFISASISELSASPSTSPMQLRSLARLDQVLPCSSLKTCRHHHDIQLT